MPLMLFKNIEASLPKCFEILPQFLTNQNFVGCTLTPYSQTTGWDHHCAYKNMPE